MRTQAGVWAAVVPFGDQVHHLNAELVQRSPPFSKHCFISRARYGIKWGVPFFHSLWAHHYRVCGRDSYSAKDKCYCC